jgi:hypothetical protein
MEPDETPENPGAYTEVVMHQVEAALGKWPIRELPAFERKIVFETARIVERDMY